MTFRIKIDAADKAFSLFIRTRDKWTCVRCYRKHPEGAGTLGNSHYWSRGKENTRFDPENCDSLCNMPCHGLWGHGDEKDQYKNFKIKQLGDARFKALDVRAHTYRKKDRKMALIMAKAMLDNLKF